MMQTIDCTTLADEALIDLLLTQEDRLPRAAVDEIVRRGVPIAPRLVALLDNESLWSDDGQRWWAVVHAFYLLVLMQPPGALDVLLPALDRAHGHDIDWITNDARFLLGAFGPPAMPRLVSAAGDRTLNVRTRISVLFGIAWIGRKHDECRNAALAALRAAVRDKADGDCELRAFAGCELLDFALPEDKDLILSTVDGWIFNEEDVRDVYSGKSPPRSRAAVDWMRFYSPGEIEERQARWRREGIRHNDEAEDVREPVHPWANTPDEPFVSTPPAPPDEPSPIRTGPKVGRNDPCPCGSGKKFKRCCGG